MGFGSGLRVFGFARGRLEGDAPSHYTLTLTLTLPLTLNPNPTLTLTLTLALIAADSKAMRRPSRECSTWLGLG